MSRYDPIPTHNDDDLSNGATTNDSILQQQPSSSPGSYHNNNHQRFNNVHVSTSSSSAPFPPSSSSPPSGNRLNNSTNTNSSFFPDFTSTIRTRASSIISISSSSLRSSTNANASAGTGGGNTSQRSSYSDHGSESSAPFMPLLPHNNKNNSASNLEEGLFPPHPFSPPGITAALASAFSSIQSRDNSDNTAFDKGSINSNSSGKKKASIRTPRHIIRLRWIWALALLAGEHGSFWIMVQRCSWPESSSWVIIPGGFFS